MAPTGDRTNILETRCTNFALELLQQLKEDPQFPQLVARLEKLRGTIFRSDIEHEFTELRRGNER